MKKNSKELISLIISKTLIFIVVVLLVSAFGNIFSSDNSLIGVTSIVLMLVLLEMDLTIHPLKNLLGLVGFNLALGVSAYFVSNNLILALILNFLIMSFIGYYFSYELKKPVNMMIGLHYILMIVSPVAIDKLPLRLLSLITGAVLIMTAQMLANKNKLIKSRKKIIDNLYENLLLKIDLLKTKKETTDVDNDFISNVNKLKSIIAQSGKSESHLTECGKNTINILSSLEKINMVLDNSESEYININFLDDIYNVINDLKNERFNIDIFSLEEKYTNLNLDTLNDSTLLSVFDFINAIKTLNIELLEYNKVTSEQKDLRDELSIPDEFKKLNINKNNFTIKSTRVAYGLRLGLVVSLTFFFVSLFNIEFGEWAVYTVFALTQPHSEYTTVKSKKRILGTIIGSIIIAILFNTITDPGLRTIMLVTVGYLMSYASDYRDLVIFITISAIASAAVYVVNPNYIIINRVFFVIVGIVIALVANKFILPRKLRHEEDTLNNIQRQASKKMIAEVILNEGSNNESVMGLLSLVPSLVDLRIDYLKQNGLNMDKSFINNNKVLMNDLYQIHLLEKDDLDYSNAFNSVKECTSTSSTLEGLFSEIQYLTKVTNSPKEKLLLSKICKVLHNAIKIDSTEEYQTDLYQFLTAIS